MPCEHPTQYVTMLKNELRNYPPRKPPEECHYSFGTSETFRGTQMLCSGDDKALITLLTFISACETEPRMWACFRTHV